MSESKKHFLAEIEEEILATWEKEKTFQKSLDIRKDGKLFNFYDGPPFANGVPHYGHLEQTTIKDTVTRFKTMQGYYVPRRVGWDTHGLPVEYAIEKEHGFKSKKDIVEFGIDKFNAECRASVYKYKDVWEKMFKRVGRWADYDNTYSTLDESYIESVWWVLKSLYDKELVYKDFRSSPYCPRCATPLSNFELNQGYQDDVEDPSLYVMFKLVGEDANLLGWTTTPWSLPGNAAIAVNPDAVYVYVQLKADDGKPLTVVLAKDRLEALDSDDYHVVKEVKGTDLVGLSYEPLFKLKNPDDQSQDKLYKVWTADFVSLEDGSGVLHVAPAFGEDDLGLAKDNGLPVFITVDENGHVVSDQGLPEGIAGKFFKGADDPIIAHLTKNGRVYAAETFKHTYPFCWRCDTPLLYYATDNWLIKVNDMRGDLVANNDKINWVPGHIKKGRFGKWLEGARDWGISRNRFWGAPLPIWVTEDGEVTVIGSLEELKAKAINPDKIGDLHRPYIDEIKIKTDSGKIATRIPEVFDCWFESGSMPYAQDHYPFENKEQWEKQFPADFIAEAIDQTRGWFYTLHVLGTALFEQPAFKNAICSGWIVAADGEKLSKRKKNYAPMDEVFDQYGVDTMRWFMASSPLMNGEDTRFSVDFLRDVQRNVLMNLNNIFNFYKLYAEVDKWTPKNPLQRPGSTNLLDQWVLARLDQAIEQTTEALEGYRLDKSTRPITELLDDISNWYVRRSRRRFWKPWTMHRADLPSSKAGRTAGASGTDSHFSSPLLSQRTSRTSSSATQGENVSSAQTQGHGREDDGDKEQAYATLHYVLLRTTQLMAPFSPFLPDHIWRELLEGTDLPESVHLSDWPFARKNQNDFGGTSVSKPDKASLKLLEDMKNVRDIVINDGLSQRAEKGIKVRQPLASATVNLGVENEAELGQIIAEELNVKEVNWSKTGKTVVVDTKLTPELKTEGVMRELVRNVQNARKKAGLNVEDRIKLRLEADAEDITEAITKFKDVIFAEALVAGELKGEGDYTETVKVEGQQVKISLSKD
ncbi:MAG: isoleucine--tRNA ligase [bacterium]|nr:isoleucine--tRNA ligase [bacterium]